MLAILATPTFGIGAGIAMFVWAFFYNSYYTRKLLEHGYVLADSETMMDEARQRLRIG